MNPKSYRLPIDPGSNRVRCPVCHHAVYSRGDIHPQCAVRQSDPPKPKPKAQVPSGPAEQAGDGAERAGIGALVEPPTAGGASAPALLAV
jgi:hypothetical protein